MTDVVRGKIPYPREPSWHRNVRTSRPVARGIITVDKLGLALPPAIVAAAKGALFEHHAIDADTMLSWKAQQKM